MPYPRCHMRAKKSFGVVMILFDISSQFSCNCSDLTSSILRIFAVGQPEEFRHVENLSCLFCWPLCCMFVRITVFPQGTGSHLL